MERVCPTRTMRGERERAQIRLRICVREFGSPVRRFSMRWGTSPDSKPKMLPPLLPLHIRMECLPALEHGADPVEDYDGIAA
eukprot:ctg_1606.g443